MKVVAERKRVSARSSTSRFFAAPPGSSSPLRSCRASSGRCPRRSCPSRGVPLSPRWSAPPSRSPPFAARSSGEAPRSSSRASSPSRRRSWRCATDRSPPTTAPSTSRSAATSRTSRRPSEHERCGGHLMGPLLATATFANLLASRAPAEHEAGSAAGGVPGRDRGLDRDLRLDAAKPRAAGSRARSRSPATSSSTGSRPPSRAPSSSRSPRPRSTPASSSRTSSSLSALARHAPLPMTQAMGVLANFGSTIQNFATELAAGHVLPADVRRRVPAVRTVKLMPRVKPTRDPARARPRPSPGTRSPGSTRRRQELQEVVDFLRDPKRFEKLGARVPRGDPLPRPSGNRQDAGREGGRQRSREPRFYAQSASAFVEMFAGLGAARIRKLFEEARENAPSIIFIDELDAVGRARTGQLVQPRAGPDAEPAARRARRLRPARPGDHHGRLQPAPGSRPGAAAPGPLRPPDLHPAARPEGPRRHPARAHARQAAHRRHRSRLGRPAHRRPHGRRPGEHLQRGRDLGRPARGQPRSPRRTSSTRWTG